MFFFFARFLMMLWRIRCRRRAFRLVRKGDVAGAFHYVEGEIELKGPSGDRCYTLGALLNYQREWEKALLAFDEAMWLEGPQPEYLTQKAIALWRLDRLEEAAILMEEVCRGNLQDLDALCNYCLILLEVGRREEARKQFLRADKLCRSTVAFPRSAWSARKRMVRYCRQRLSGESND